MHYTYSEAKSNLYTLCNISDIDICPYRIVYECMDKVIYDKYHDEQEKERCDKLKFIQNIPCTGLINSDDHKQLWIIPRESEKETLNKLDKLDKLASESNDKLDKLKISFVYDDELYRTLFPNKNIVVGYDDHITLLLREQYERALPHGVQGERVIHFSKGLTWILNELMNKLASVCPNVALKQTDKYKFVREYLTYTDDNHTLPMQYFWIRPDKSDESNQLHNEMQERYETKEKSGLVQTWLDKFRDRVYTNPEIDVFYQFNEKIRPFPTPCTQFPSIRALFDEILNYCSPESDTIFIGWPALSHYLTKSNKSWCTDYTNCIPLFESENDCDRQQAKQFLEPIKKIIHTIE